VAFEQEARQAEEVEPRKQANFRGWLPLQRSTTQINEALLALTRSKPAKANRARCGLALPEATLVSRRAAMQAKGKLAWKPNRDRKVSTALRAYGALATSASTGAVRDLGQIDA
jgi:hypothetical protein